MARCPSAPVIERFASGCLAPAELAEVSEHIASCESCEGIAEEFSNDPLLLALREGASGEYSQAGDYELDSAERKPFAAALLAAKRFGQDRHSDPSPLAMEDQALGPVLRDYRLLRKLGEGGMGTVYQAIHTRLHRHVALKVLPPERMQDQHAVDRFQQEMRAVGLFDDPAIVRAMDAGDVDGTHFLVMEYVEGCDLAALARTLGPLAIAESCEIIRQAAEGLRRVHAQGMVHRDIKPSNLMLTPAGRVKILDLGLALLQDTAMAHELTTVGQFLGTLDYIAPEQASDSHIVDIRADIYGLGATLYRLIAGRSPFSTAGPQSPLKKLRAIALDEVTDIRQLRPEVPEALAEIVHRMLAKDPEERFASPEAVADALRPFVTDADLARLQEEYEIADPPAERSDSRGVKSNAISEPPPRRSSGPHVQFQKQPPARGGNRRRWWILATLPFWFLLGGVLIYLQTNRGTLEIRAPQDGIEVLIRRSDKQPVDTWELQSGQNRTRLWAGEYEITVLAAADQWQVTPRQIRIGRGGNQIVSVRRVAQGNGPGTGMNPAIGSGASATMGSGQPGMGDEDLSPGRSMQPGAGAPGSGGMMSGPIRMRSAHPLADEGMMGSDGGGGMDMGTPARGSLGEGAGSMQGRFEDNTPGFAPGGDVFGDSGPADVSEGFGDDSYSSGSRPSATYAGKTARQWQATLRSERDYKSVQEALLAVSALPTTPEEYRHAAELIFEKLADPQLGASRNPWTFGGTLDGQLRQAAIFALQRLDHPAAVEVVNEALLKDTPARIFALHVLRETSMGSPTGSNQPARLISDRNFKHALNGVVIAANDTESEPFTRLFALALVQERAPESEEVQQLLINLLRDDSALITHQALQFLVKSKSAKLLKQHHDLIVPALRRDVDDALINLGDRAELARKVAELAPQTPGLVELLIEWAQQKETLAQKKALHVAAQVSALRGLKTLGASAARVADTLVDIGSVQGIEQVRIEEEPEFGMEDMGGMGMESGMGGMGMGGGMMGAGMGGGMMGGAAEPRREPVEPYADVLNQQSLPGGGFGGPGGMAGGIPGAMTPPETSTRTLLHLVLETLQAMGPDANSPKVRAFLGRIVDQPQFQDAAAAAMKTIVK